MDKWTDNNMWLLFSYTVQLVISDVCTKFQSSRSSSSGEIFDQNFHIYALPWSLRDGKKKKKKAKLSTLVLFPVMHLVVLIVYMHLVVLIVYTKFEDCSTHRC